MDEERLQLEREVDRRREELERALADLRLGASRLLDLRGHFRRAPLPWIGAGAAGVLVVWWLRRRSAGSFFNGL